jgi:hypothetical protein
MCFARFNYRVRLHNLCIVTLLFHLTAALIAAEAGKTGEKASKVEPPKSLTSAVPAAKWQELEKSVDRALTWMSSQQASDGSFRTLASGQPGITSLAAMAFLSRGYQPGPGPYGERLNRAIDFVLSCQMSNGLITLLPPGPVHEDKQPSHNAVYNHVISGLLLAEIYGQVNGQRTKNVKQAIERALTFSRQLHHIRPKPLLDQGGWRYIRVNRWGSGVDSDLSVTSWHLMFLRSAKNAEFDVPQAEVDEAIAYVRRLWNPGSGAFSYDTANLEANLPNPAKHSRGMVGAGILCLSLAGEHNTPMARAAGDWLLAHPYKGFGHLASTSDRFFYGTYYSSQAMMQLGGRYWDQFFPSLVDALLSGQSSDGSWPPEIRSSVRIVGGGSEAMFGNVYSSALAVLSLTPPYQLLPIYQR